MSELETLLATALTQNNWVLPDTTQQKFSHYLDLLSEWSHVHNLTAIRTNKEAVYLHILDSLSVSAFLHGQRVIDVGTGAGLPGIPLAIVNPDKQFFLLDSNNKKVLFLNQVIYELGLKNVTAVHERSERFHPDQCFDSIVTRAFASLKDMLLATKHLLCPTGQFIAMKGVYPDAEINAIPSEFKLLAVHQLTVKGLDATRHLVSIGVNSWEK